MPDTEFLSAFFDAMPVPVYVVDQQLSVVFLNESARKAVDRTGFDRNLILGRSLFEALPFLPPAVKEQFMRVLQTGETVIDRSSYTFNNTEIHHEATRFPIRRNGKIEFVGVIYRDVTELKLTHEELRASEETARALMNSSSESMFLVGDDERLIAANATAAERLGLARDKLEGMRIYDIIPAEVADSRLANFRRVRDTGEPFRFTDERMGRVYDITMFPVPNKAGGSRRVAIYARDVTEKETTINALRASEKRFRELFDRTPVPSYVWRSEGTTLVLRDANRAAEKITEGKIGNFIGFTVEQMYAERYPDIVRDILACYQSKNDLMRELHYPMVSIDKVVFLEVHYVYVAPNEVMVHTVDLTSRREAELEQQESHAQLEQRVVERTRELAELNEQLRLEREALNQKHAAMRELIAHINDSRSDMAETIQANLHQVIAPILDRLGSRIDKSNATYLRLLRESLDDLLSPHLTGLQRNHPDLTAHEIELCNLIRSGLTCKEIAELRGRSEQTILKQRKVIRKKLGLKDEKTNLRDFLTSRSLRH